ncbi:MAG: tRNA (N6-threonylcarbamoyladenosine(37)-N6)-methyltransferase TrmO [Fibrobacterota bacterium]|nr:tRNA (N6-threonylcarbamoyladenosine(37)-N6)-methyltransferase TrmO [Chitinispirillaceae bacterium]
MSEFTARQIGVVRSEHIVPEKTPIQPVYAGECKGQIELFPEFEEGLQDIEGYSHLIILYWLHKAGDAKMLVKPFLEDKVHGIFATRTPVRPTPIGLSIVRLLERKGPVLFIQGVDMLDGTPVIDIKPYSGRFDSFPDARNGWMDGVDNATALIRGKRGYVPKK